MYFLLQKPPHILACNLQADSISWLHMASDLNVVDWKHEILFERIRAKYDHILYQNKVCDALRHNFHVSFLSRTHLSTCG